MVDIVSGRLFFLGVAIGYRPDEFDLFRVPLKRRGARFEEQVQIIHALWTQDEVYRRNPMLTKIARIMALVSVTILASACVGGNGQSQDPGSILIQPTATEGAASDRVEPTQEPGSTEFSEPANLIPSSELMSNCLNYPAEEITVANSVRLSIGLTEGRPAVEFSLWGSDGNLYSLSELLQSKPALIVLGGFT
jgi:hypothetical protein